MNIQKIVRSVTKKQIKSTQKKAQGHFELGGVGNTQMNMIAFD
ncbi:hypothetical protein [Bdellovibrio bacteriovorus]|nr:hypothetical protein [Bdellovibrio bacteriovorus]